MGERDEEGVGEVVGERYEITELVPKTEELGQFSLLNTCTLNHEADNIMCIVS